MVTRKETEVIADEIDEDLERALASAPAVKSPQTRLLDMLAGWGNYAEDDVFPDDEESVGNIWSVYQDAGALEIDSLDADARDTLLFGFFKDKILPVLTR